MIHTNEDPSMQARPGMRIIGLNTGKTRRTRGSYTVYQVYFELSGNPSLAWREIFEREWKDLGSTQEAGIDGKFLVIHCPIQDVAAMHLPALKKTVVATNTAYTQYVREQATEAARKTDVWVEERKAVEAVAKSLRFD